MGQSSFGGGSLNSASSRSSATRCLHAALCLGQCFFWHSALQYLAAIHDLHILRLAPPSLSSSLPHSAQPALIWFIPQRTMMRNAADDKTTEVKSLFFWRVSEGFGGSPSRSNNPSAMIEIVEIIWKHHEEAAAAALSLQQVTIEGWTTTTMDVGGASFALVKPVDIILAPSSATTTSTSRRRLLWRPGNHTCRTCTWAYARRCYIWTLPRLTTLPHCSSTTTKKKICQSHWKYITISPRVRSI